RRVAAARPFLDELLEQRGAARAVAFLREDVAEIVERVLAERGLREIVQQSLVHGLGGRIARLRLGPCGLAGRLRLRTGALEGALAALEVLLLALELQAAE